MLALAGLLNDEQLLASPAGSETHSPRRRRTMQPRRKASSGFSWKAGPAVTTCSIPSRNCKRKQGKRVAIDTFFGNPGPLLASPFKFKQYGEAGTWVSEVYPRLAEQADKLALVKSCYAESNNHAPAMFHMNTGLTRQGFPARARGSPMALVRRIRICRASSCWATDRGSEGGPAELEQQLFAGCLSRHAVSSRPQPGAELAGQPMYSRPTTSQLDLLARWNAAHQAAHPDETDLFGHSKF